MTKTAVPGTDIFIKGFAVERERPTYVRIVERETAKTIRVDKPHRLVDDVVEVAAPSEQEKADTKRVQIKVDKPSRLLKAARSKRPIIIEVQSGERIYRNRIPASMRTLRFNFFYNESDPGLINCPRHGVVRAKNHACPYPPPHTPL